MFDFNLPDFIPSSFGDTLDFYIDILQYLLTW